MGYIKIQEILEELMDNPLLRGLTLERTVNYTQQFIRKVGSPKLFEDKVATIKIHNYRGELPCDFVDILGVRCQNGNSLLPTTDLFFAEEVNKPKPEKLCDNKFIKQDKIFTDTLFQVQDIQVPEAYINMEELDEKDKIFLQNHPEIKNKLLYIMIKKAQEAEQPIEHDIPQPRRDKYIITEEDLFGIDKDLLEDVQRILNAFIVQHVNHCNEQHRHPHNDLAHKTDNLYKVGRDPQKPIHRKSYGDDMTNLTYKIQGNFIFTTLSETTLQLAYRSIATDEDGFPMVYDNESYIEALKAYIKLKCYNIEFDLGRIAAPVFQNAQQQYAWYVGQAQTSLIKPSYDDMEVFTRTWNTLIQRNTLHDNQFRTQNNREYIKRQ